MITREGRQNKLVLCNYYYHMVFQRGQILSIRTHFELFTVNRDKFETWGIGCQQGHFYIQYGHYISKNPSARHVLVDSIISSYFQNPLSQTCKHFQLFLVSYGFRGFWKVFQEAFKEKLVCVFSGFDCFKGFQIIFKEIQLCTAG